MAADNAATKRVSIIQQGCPWGYRETGAAAFWFTLVASKLHITRFLCTTPIVAEIGHGDTMGASFVMKVSFIANRNGAAEAAAALGRCRRPKSKRRRYWPEPGGRGTTIE
jgi:hypothetical protein